MPNTYVNKVTANGQTLIDLTADTAVASDVAQGKYFHLATGERVQGTASGGGGDTYTRTVVVPQQTVTPNSSRVAAFTSNEYFVDGEYYVVTYDGTEYIVTAETLWSNNVVLGDAQVVWTTNDVLYPFALITDGSAREGYFATTSQHTIKVEHIEFVDGPLNLIAKSVTANGTYSASSDNADGYSSVTVNVPSGGGTMQTKTVTPTTSQQTVAPDSGYDGLSQVTVNAIPSQYIVPSGNKAITANGTGIDVTNYASVDVAVPSGGSSNLVMGTFVADSGTGAAHTVSVPYTGTGYPIAAMVFIAGGAYESGTTWYTAIQRYAVGQWTYSKSVQDTAPTWTSSGAENQGVTTWVFKNSTSSASSYSRSSAMSTNVLTSSSTNASNAGSTCVRFKGNGKTLSYYTAASGSYGLLAGETYKYIIIYSS